MNDFDRNIEEMRINKSINGKIRIKEFIDLFITRL